MRYSIRKNRLNFLFKVKNVTIKSFPVLDCEHKYINSFIDTYFMLSAKDRGKIDLMSSKHRLYRCWYYARVWYYTRESLAKTTNNKECIDHILPIIRGFKNNIAPENIGSIENIQFLTHKQNLHKGTKLTKKGKDLLQQFISL